MDLDSIPPDSGSGIGFTIQLMIIGFITTGVEMIGWFLETKLEHGLSLMLVGACGLQINGFITSVL